jgi:hypothetical protein
MSDQTHADFKNLLVGLEMMITEIKINQNIKVVIVQEASWECRDVVKDLANFEIRLRK